MKNIISIIIICFSILSYYANSQTIITLTTNKDATVSLRQPFTNFGNSQYFNCYFYNGKWAETQRSLIEFDFSSIPAGATIINARLKLYGINHVGNNASYIVPLDTPWEENTVTWSNQPLGIKGYEVYMPQSTSPDENYIVEIKDFVQECIDGQIDNNGLVLGLGVNILGLENGLYFASSDYLGPSKNPELEIIYEVSEGTTCETAISIDQIPSYETYKFNSNELWLKFVADTNVITILNYESDSIPNANVDSICFYVGTCNNLNLFTNGDSVFISTNNLVQGEEYYIKVSKNNYNSEYTSIYIYEDYTSKVLPIDCEDGTYCNLIHNGDFQDIVIPPPPPLWPPAPGSLISGFWWELCPGWDALCLTPDIKFENPIAPYNAFAHLWSNSNIPSNEAILTCVDFTNSNSINPPIVSGDNFYILSYKLRTEIGTFSDFYVALTNQSNQYSNMTPPPWYPGLPPNSMSIDEHLNFSNNVWQDIAICFGLNTGTLANWNALTMFANPSASQVGDGGTQVDDISIVPINIYLEENNELYTHFDLCNDNINITVPCFDEIPSNISATVELFENGVSIGFINSFPYFVTPNSGLTTYTGILTIIDSQGIHSCELNELSVNKIIVDFDISSANSCENPNTSFATVLNPTSTCPGNTGFSYSWDPGGLTTQTITGLQSGVYSVTVTDDCGCTDDDQVTITIFDNPEIQSVNIIEPLCFGMFSGSINITVIGGTPVYSYDWGPNGYTGDGTNEYSGLPSDNYTITVTDVNGCTIDETYTVNQPTQLEIDEILTISTTCIGNNDGSVTITVIGGTPDYLLNLNNSSGPILINNLFPSGSPSSITIQGLNADDYNFVVVDDNGCNIEGSFTIEDGGPVITLTPNLTVVPCIDCCIGSVDISIDGGIPPYTIDINNVAGSPFTNIPAGITQTIPNLCPIGQYNIVVTDADGCTASETITYNPLPSVPVIEITEPTDCVFADNGSGVPSTVTFSADYVSTVNFPNAQFIWDFGDGSPTVISNPGIPVQHAFDVGDNYGYYCVTVTMNSCCTQTWTQSVLVYVHPTKCTCPDNPFLYDHHVDLTIPLGTTNWSSLNSAVFGANLIIPAGATLNLNNCVLNFGPESKVIVEQGTAGQPGGVLNLFGTSKLSNDYVIDVCYYDYMWQGVEVWGVPTLNSDNPMQGRLTIGPGPAANEVTIEHAYIGVLLGARNEDHLCNGAPIFDLALSGGIIKSEECTYLANGVDIHFVEKDNNRDGNENEIINNDFIGREVILGNPVPLLDPRYINTTPNFYPSMQNPWAGAANPYGKGAVGIMVNQLERVRIRDNSFDDIHRCIRTFDTRHAIRNCTFNNTLVGIEIRNMLSVLTNAHLITDNCTFDNLTPISTALPDRAIGIYMGGGILEQIDHCTFGELTPKTDITAGIETMNSNNYRIVDNDFYNLTGGLLLRNTIQWTPTGPTSFVGNADDQAGNFFNECRFGIFSEMTNNAVVVDCNRFNPVDLSNPTPFYNRNMKNNFGIFKNQGSSSDPVASLFNGLNQNRKLIRTNPTNPYFYWCFNGNITNPWIPTVEQVIRPITSIPFIQSNICNPLLPIVPVVNNFQTIIDDLEMEYENILINIDNGKTAELLADIYGTLSGGLLKNKLIDNSPLSDELLLALITEDRLSPGDYKNVMEENLPVTDVVKSKFENYLLDLPPGIADQLAQLQEYNPGIITLASIKQEIDHYISKRRNVINAMIINEIFENEDVIEAWQLFINEGGLDVEMALYSKSYIEGDLVSARIQLESITIEDQNQQEWVDLHTLLLDLKEDTISLYELDTTQLNFVRQLAVKCEDGGIASSNARALLSYYYNEDYYCDWDPFSETKLGMVSNNTNIEQEYFIETELENKELFLGQNYPNPFAKTTIIPYKLPEGEDGVIKITNYEGKTIEEIKVNSSCNKVDIKTKDWANGVYYYTLDIDGETIGSKRMILIK